MTQGAVHRPPVPETDGAAMCGGGLCHQSLGTPTLRITSLQKERGVKENEVDIFNMFFAATRSDCHQPSPVLLTLATHGAKDRTASSSRSAGPKSATAAAVDAAVPSHEASIVRPLPAAQPPPPQTPAAAAAPPPPPPLSAVTDAQRQRAEANRLKALERKRERDAAAAATDAAGEQPAKR